MRAFENTRSRRTVSTTAMARLFVAAAGCALVLVAPACSSGPEKVDYAREFPRALPRKETLDIQVFRQSQEIEFTNTTARSFGPSTLWLNGRFSRPIAGLAVGETLKFRLREFRDQYGDPFREGGFFATEKPEKLVLAQLETPDGGGNPIMLGLIVVGTESDE